MVLSECCKRSACSHWTIVRMTSAPNLGQKSFSKSMSAGRRTEGKTIHTKFHPRHRAVPNFAAHAHTRYPNTLACPVRSLHCHSSQWQGATIAPVAFGVVEVTQPVGHRVKVFGRCSKSTQAPVPCGACRFIGTHVLKRMPRTTQVE